MKLVHQGAEIRQALLVGPPISPGAGPAFVQDNGANGQLLALDDLDGPAHEGGIQHLGRGSGGFGGLLVQTDGGGFVPLHPLVSPGAVERLAPPGGSRSRSGIGDLPLRDQHPPKPGKNFVRIRITTQKKAKRSATESFSRAQA